MRTQGVDRWQLRVQRAADTQLDAFELHARQSVFAIPPALELAPPGAPSEAELSALDAETATLRVRLQQALATKRELKRKLAAAQNVSALWEAHRGAVQQLAASQQLDGAVGALEGTQEVHARLKQGWKALGGPPDPSAAPSGAAAAPGPGPRGLQQRFTQRRAEISTVSVPDLSLLSNLLCAS